MAPYISAEAAVAELEGAQNKVIDIRGQASLKTYDPEGKLVNSVSGYMAFKRPDKFRFTYVGPLGIVLFEALVNDKTMILFLPQQLTAYKGSTETPSGGPFSANLMRAPFSPLRGRIFTIEHDGDKSTLYAIAQDMTDKKGYALTEKIIFSRTDMRPLVREGYQDGLLAWRVTYKKYEVVGGIPIPSEIMIEDPSSGGSMEIGLSDAKVNTGIGEDAFDPSVKPPYTEAPLESFAPPDF
jgi:outer membrane lipoprotein-sorting protein